MPITRSSARCITGYVVEEIEATVERLVNELGAGPFFVLRDVSFEQVTSGGEPATFDHDSAHVELHADSLGLRDFFALIQDASVEWDGSDPLRSVG